MRVKLLAPILACAALALLLAACGGGGDSEQNAGAATTPTVSVKQVEGIGQVLVDDHGAALYTSDQEQDGKIRCTGACVGFWLPLEAGSSKPTGSDEVGGKLGTVKRPDSGTQVTFDGKPLYRFSEDKSGKVTGNGFSDDFGGRKFTWTAATASGKSSSSSDSGGSRSYGY